MKCLCGYEEPENWSEPIEVLFQAGKRKGQVKEIKTVYHDVKEEDKFIRISVEKDFGFVVKKHHDWYGSAETLVGLYACPRCLTVKMEGY